MTNAEITVKTVLKTKANFEKFIEEYNPQIITSTIAGMPNANDRIVVKICDLTQNIDTLMDALTEEIIVNLEKPPIVAWMVTNEKEKIQNFVRILNQQSGTRGLKIFVFKASVNQDESDINIECILKPQYKENKYVRNDNTHAKIIQNEYWKKYLEITGRKISPGPRHYQRISVGKSGVEIMQTVNTAKNYVATEILIRENKDLYTRFLENNEKLGKKMIIDPVYIDFINDLIEDKENVDYIANKYSAIKVMRGDKLIAIVMPKKITLNNEQIKLIMVNNFKEYLAYMDLIPIEYKILGNEGINGLFLPRLFNDTQIKNVIKSHVKHNGGRWLGKFERRPDLIDQYTKMIGEQLDKSDKSGILKAMKKAEEKTKEEQACKTEN